MPELKVASALPPAGLFSRLGALISDCLVVFGLLALTTLFVFVPVLSALGKKAMMPSEVGWLWSIIYFAVMAAVWFGFFGYFWIRSGQTIGMRAWRIRLLSNRNNSITWAQAFGRWVCALAPWLPGLILQMLAEQLGSSSLKYLGQASLVLGLVAWISMYFDPQRRLWHDRMSDTRVIKLPKL
jgi:uncharacterized RDD family membrane protein YckC